MVFHLLKLGCDLGTQLGNKCPFHGSGTDLAGGGGGKLQKRPQRKFQIRLAISHLMLTPSHILINNYCKSSWSPLSPLLTSITLFCTLYSEQMASFHFLER